MMVTLRFGWVSRESLELDGSIRREPQWTLVSISNVLILLERE